MHEVLCKKTQHATSLKTAMSFSEVLSKKPNFAKYEIVLQFFSQKKLKNIQLSPNMNAT
jgi:hypothetical protein